MRFTRTLPPSMQVTGGEAMYDQRLFNQDTGLGGPGMGQGEARMRALRPVCGLPALLQIS